MTPPVYAVVKKSSAVLAALGSPLPRVYPFGLAPQDPVKPYAVWQLIPGGPQNYLGDLPDIDEMPTQIDVYGTTADSVRSAAVALRDAIEPYAHVTGWRGETRDTETTLYRFSFDVDWWVPR